MTFMKFLDNNICIILIAIVFSISLICEAVENCKKNKDRDDREDRDD